MGLERALTYDAERHADEVQELKLRLISLENRMEATERLLWPPMVNFLFPSLEAEKTLPDSKFS